MSKEITTSQPTALENTIATIAKAAADPNTNVTMMRELLLMQKEIMATQAKIDFDQAMSRLQQKLPTIHKATKGHNGNYALYEDVDGKTRPFYTAEGFSISYDSRKNADNTTTFIGTLSHVSGHSKTAELDLPVDTSGNKAAIQGKASTLSYAKRYLLQMLLNIVTTNEDNDGDDSAEGQPIAEELAEAITKRIEALKDAKEYTVKFLKYMNVPSVSGITQRDYAKAINALSQKEKASK